MLESEQIITHAEQSVPPASYSPQVIAGASALALAACGGGGSSGGAPSNSTPATPPTAVQASGFLGKSAFGATTEDLTRVQTVGIKPWLEEQFALPRETSHWDWLIAKGLGTVNGLEGFDETCWRQLISAKDVLRQRVALALSEIIVVSVNGLTASWRSYQAAAYLDVLADNAFGNYRTLLEKISTLPAMGYYLTFINSNKANPATGTQPDENYARELMQLFTIGLYELNPDGTLKRDGAGNPIETYDQDDISGLARVFTGWGLDSADNTTPDRMRRPMVQTASRHETGVKTFLNATIPASTDGVQSLRLALDTLYAHPNLAPFISKQLIQRLVTSNPSPAYVQRVSAVFSNNGSGVKGDLKAVITAILTDSEALAPPAGNSGKLREPIVRFVSWARVFGATSPGDLWNIGTTSDAGTRLGQSPGRSDSVFNFFRPGYVPPGTAIAQQGLVAPELQITNESSVAGYLNFMQGTIQNGRGDVKADYATGWVPLAADARKLLDQINLQLAGGAISSNTINTLSTAVSTISSTTANGLLQRVQAAIMLVMAAPEYIVQK